MASNWTGIISRVDTGDVVEDKLTSAFENIDNDTDGLDGRLTIVEAQAEDIGHLVHLHVINNTGAILQKGTIVRHNGVDVLGNVQVAKAMANTFQNAVIFGVIQDNILNGEIGFIILSGTINNVDTSALPSGVPLYLSETVAGTLTATPPDIISQAGGVTVSAVDGQMVVNINSLFNLPDVVAFMQGQLGSGIYALTNTPLNIANYAIGSNLVMEYDLVTGKITIPIGGLFRASVSGSISFATNNQTRTMIISVYNATQGVDVFQHVVNIPKDATATGFSFAPPYNFNTNDEVMLRIESADNFTVTIEALSFDMASKNIR